MLEGFKHYKTESFATFCVSAANGTTFYFGSVFLGVFIKNNKPEIEVAFISTLVSITVAVFVPIFGFISDFIDRKKIPYDFLTCYGGIQFNRIKCHFKNR